MTKPQQVKREAQKGKDALSVLRSAGISRSQVAASARREAKAPKGKR